MNYKLICFFIISAAFTLNAYCGEWITDPTVDCKVWNPYPEPDETISYNGKCKGGIANGKGTLIWKKNGETTSIYEGHFVNGRRHGEGKVIWKGGLASGDDWYVGDFLNGSITGFGEKTYRCNCGAWSCKQCTDRGIFKDGELITHAPEGVNSIAEYKTWQKNQNRKNIEYNTQVNNFRKSLAIGDETSIGIVIEIKGTIVKVQTNESQCTQRDNNNSCQNWISTPIEKWVKLKDIYPN